MRISPFEKIDLNKFFKPETSDKNKKEDNKEIPFIDKFKKKYFSTYNYYYFESIFEYVIGNKAFYINDLQIELESYFIVKNGKIPEHEKVLQELDYENCLKLIDKEYKNLTIKMLEFVDQGNYSIRQYANVFHYATRFENILNFNIENLKKRFKKGILKGKSNFIYDDHIRFNMNFNNTEYKDDLIEINKFCLEVNETLKNNNEAQVLDEIFKLFKSDFEVFIKKVDDKDNRFRYSPFWLKFDIKQIVKVINKLENDQIVDLGHYFKRRFRKHISSDLHAEKEFIIELRKKIDSPRIKRKRKTLHNASLNVLTNFLKECESNFPI